MPIDESQVDLSAQDRARLSLKTGATQAMPVIKAPAQALPGERMDEAEMLAELNQSRKYFIIAGAVVMAVVLAVVFYFATRSAPKAEAPTPEKPAPVAAAPPRADACCDSACRCCHRTFASRRDQAAARRCRPPHRRLRPSPSQYAAQVAKLEAVWRRQERRSSASRSWSPSSSTRAPQEEEHDVEAADRDLLARLKKLRGR